MKYSDLMSGVFWLIVGLLFSFWSIHYKIGNITQPGPGFLPLALGFLLIFLSITLLIQARKSFLTKDMVSPFLSAGWEKVAYTILILFLTTFLFERIGYLLTVFFLMLFLMLVGGLKSWKKILLIAFLAAAGVYLVFVLLLEQSLPRGFLGS